MRPLQRGLLFTLILTAIFHFTCRAETGAIEKTRFLMATIAQVKIPISPDFQRAGAEDAMNAAFAEMERVEGLFSVFLKSSEISRINSGAAPHPVKVSGEVFALIEKSLKYSQATDGAFDITVKPLVELWKKAGASGKIPSEEELKAVMAAVGSEKVILDKSENSVSFTVEGMSLDMGAVAKGYAVDRAVKVLSERGISNALVSAGGDIYCMGVRSEKSQWRIGIQHPRDKQKVIRQIYLKDAAVDTSGDYEKYSIIAGKRYSHIIDPRTGYPIGDDVVSATVITDNSTKADMLATALCVLGKKGLPIAEDEGAEACVIYKNGDKLDSYTTSGFGTEYGLNTKK